MPAFLTQLIEQWRRLTLGQRIGIIGAAVATLGLTGAIVFYSSQPEYAVLFSDLKPEDGQSIVEKLKAAAVPYKLSGDGAVISVPSERVTELRMEMAASGMLAGGHVGFDLFDRTSFGATDFAQQVNYQRALEGELARTLEGTDEVETARVHITRSRESVFTEKAERAKASVVVRMRQNRELSRERTAAVVNLVASAVEGLDPGDVSVMDTRGRLLSAPSRDGGGGPGGGGGASMFNSQFEARRRFESETATRLVSLLEPVTGIGHVRADVAADLDFNQTEQTEEKYGPQPAVVRSQQTAQETRSGRPSAGGVVGTRANDPTAQPPPVAATTAAGGAAAGDQRTATTTTYEIDKTLRRTVGTGGRIARLSVSVVVDHKKAEGTTTNVARTGEELQKIQQLVTAAAGIDTARGDVVVVQTMPFDQPNLEAIQLPWAERNRDLVQSGIKYGALIFALLLLILFIIRPLLRSLRAAAVPAPLLASANGAPALALAGGEAPGTNDGTALLSPAAQDSMRQLAEPSLPAASVGPRTVAELEAEMEAQMQAELDHTKAAMAPEVTRANVLRKQITELIESKPEEIVMTLRGWLQDASASSVPSSSTPQNGGGGNNSGTASTT